MENLFGEFIRTRREAKRITLRAFSQKVGIDSANYSKTERGVTMPPEDGERLEAIRTALGIERGGEDHREMLRLAAIGREKIPAGVMRNQIAAEGLPVLFRALEETPLDQGRFRELVEALRKE